jgi:hypothetical protein
VSSDPACNACGDQQCCAEQAACADATSCGDFLACLQPCTTDACREGCVKGECAGATLYAAVVTCHDAKCAPSCGDLSGPSFLGCGIAWKTEACAACMTQKCCCPSLGCGVNTECVPYLLCLAGCSGDAACQSACGTQHQGGVTAANVMGTCISMCPECK